MVVEVDVIPVVSQDIWQGIILQAVVLVIRQAVEMVVATIVENRGTLLENALPILDTSTDYKYIIVAGQLI
ncbi:hypothetical protein Ccrd_005678 [Cynara cardunculus var. scolymus]|uniref:Uncharacterized protein n=1 Tax=Cynara cardunculus var. scolymus TaxID=59895 RepID=A0A103XK89_CYNCS|nr:hypothetical protein Ccrd_005678 [Cynara cardunculus var. scolymus]